MAPLQMMLNSSSRYSQRFCDYEFWNVLGCCTRKVVPVDFSQKWKYTVVKWSPADPGAIFFRDINALKVKVKAVSFIFSKNFTQKAQCPAIQIQFLVKNPPYARFGHFQFKRRIHNRETGSCFERWSFRFLQKCKGALRRKSLLSPKSVTWFIKNMKCTAKWSEQTYQSVSWIRKPQQCISEEERSKF